MTHEVVAPSPAHIPAMSEAAIAGVRALERWVLAQPQRRLHTDHVLHRAAGTYTRTLFVPAKVLITGALVKIPTTLIVAGDAYFLIDGLPQRITGWAVLAADANRKQGIEAITDTMLAMMFKTGARTIAEAEEEFTDEAHLLFSRQLGYTNSYTVTGG